MEHTGSIVVLDFGGQYAHLIARRVRQCGVFSEIYPADTSAKDLKNVAGIILSGGPQSVYDPDSPQGDPAIFELGVPVLGICYGLHWMTQTLGGSVESGDTKEYGKTVVRKADASDNDIFKDCPDEFIVWMSHGDEAKNLPEGFTCTLTSDACTNAAFADPSRHFYAVQFHPEVTHSQCGMEILNRFVQQCNAAPWSIESYAKEVGDQLLKEIGDKNVFMLVSGGVDSTVAFTLLNEVLGTDRVQGLLVDTGLMRKNEVQMIKDAFDRLGITNLRIEDASEEFFAALKDVYEPEAKRKIIGDTFLAVQKRVSEEMNLRIEDNWMLGQGTIYPDTIETGGTKHADHIKTHHNRVDAIQKMMEEGFVIEPLKELYKDEVRKLGEELGLPHELVWRHPFPGPGLGVRILCADPKEDVSTDIDVPTNLPHTVLPVKSVGVQGDGRTYRSAVALFDEDEVPTHAQYELATGIPNRSPDISRVIFCLSHEQPVTLTRTPQYITRERADLLREADAIVDAHMRQANLYEKIWQFPVVLLPVGTTEGGQSIVLRPVESQEAMTANATELPEEVLQHIAHDVMKLEGIDAVFVDMTNKPPGTIEWE